MKTSLSEIKREELEEIVKNSYTYKDVLVKLGYCSSSGGSYRTLRDKINKWNIDTSHFKQVNRSQKPLTAKDLFVENCQHGRNSVKRYILKHNLIPYQCAICGNTGEWNNKPLTLTLDHINGINNDNRLENLRFVCPNCDSQQDTYGSKNRNNKREYLIKENKKFCQKCGREIGDIYGNICRKCFLQSKYPTKEKIIEDFKTINSFKELCRKYKIDRKTLIRICENYELPHITKDIKEWVSTQAV